MKNLIIKTVLSYLFHSKLLVALLCGIGILALSYGMLNDDNLIFIIGLVFVIGGYLLLRRKLKQHASNFQEPL